MCQCCLHPFVAALVAILAVVPYATAPLEAEFVVLPPLGKLEPNGHLEATEHLFEGDLIGPEALVVDSTGSIITGLADGRIVKVFSKDDGQVTYETLGRTGEEVEGCGADIELEHICGRPLGLKLSQGGKTLLIADGYKGLLEMDLASREISVLATEVEGGPALTLPNAIEETEDGTIYLTDTSTEVRRNRIFWAAISGKSTGRLLKCRRDGGGKCEGLVTEGLFMPNGIVFDHDRRCLLIAMTILGEVKRYCLEGPDKGVMTTFAKNLPGTLDNIHQFTEPKSGKKGYVVGMGAKYAKPFSLLNALQGFPSLRQWIIGLPVPYELNYKLIPPYGMLGFLDAEGQLVQTLQDPTARTSWLSEGIVVNGSLWMGTWLHPWIARRDFTGTVAEKALAAAFE